MRKAYLTLVFVIFATVSLFAGDLIRARYKLWPNEIEGDILADELSGVTRIIGNKLDLKDSLNIDDIDSGANVFEVSLNPGILGLKFNLSYWAGDYKGNKTISQSFTYKGRTFTVNIPTTSSLELTSLEGTIEWGLSPGLFGLKTELGLFIGANYVTVDGEISQATLGLKASAKEQAPIPLVGARLRVDLFETVYAQGKLAGFQAEISDVKGEYLELDLEAGWHLLKFFTVFAGYKTIGIFVEKKDDPKLEVDLDIKGFLIGAGFSY